MYWLVYGYSILSIRVVYICLDLFLSRHEHSPWGDRRSALWHACLRPLPDHQPGCDELRQRREGQSRGGPPGGQAAGGAAGEARFHHGDQNCAQQRRPKRLTAVFRPLGYFMWSCSTLKKIPLSWADFSLRSNGESIIVTWRISLGHTDTESLKTYSTVLVFHVTAHKRLHIPLLSSSRRKLFSSFYIILNKVLFFSLILQYRIPFVNVCNLT